MPRLFDDYTTGTAYDEMFDADAAREPYLTLSRSFADLDPDDVRARVEAMQTSYLDQGVTFDIGGEERAFPLDIVPRVIEMETWPGGRRRRPAAGPGAGGLPRRRLRRRAGVPGRRDPAPRGHHLVALPPRGRRGAPAQRRTRPRLGHRPDPRRRRGLPRPRGQRAGALGRVLRDDQPALDRGGAARGVRRPPDPPGRRLPAAAARPPCAPRPPPASPTRPSSC